MALDASSAGNRIRRRARRRTVFTVTGIVVAILIASGVVMILGRW